MSLSNPTSNTPNPATRFFQWAGDSGSLSYYDKAAKQNKPVDSKFVFILLDQLSTVKGWHEGSQSGIYSNEVRDTRTEPFTVKAFKGGELCRGIYQTIKDTITAHGGKFTANLYIAFKGDDGKLTIGSLQFKGGALSAWFDFVKQHRSELQENALYISGSESKKNGSVTYRVPTFAFKPIQPETLAEAVKLDRQLQEYLSGYFERTKTSGVARDAVGEQHDGADAQPTDETGEASPFNFDPQAASNRQQSRTPAHEEADEPVPF